MPWKETCQVQERLKLILELEEGEKSVSQISREFEVARQTAYKWLRRYHDDPCGLLEDQSRRPLSSPHELGVDLVELIVAIRKKWHHWGPRKVREKLEELWTGRVPATSTIGAVLPGVRACGSHP